jgi:hypothetical protein
MMFKVAITDESSVHGVANRTQSASGWKWKWGVAFLLESDGGREVIAMRSKDFPLVFSALRVNDLPVLVGVCFLFPRPPFLS